MKNSTYWLLAAFLFPILASAEYTDENSAAYGEYETTEIADEGSIHSNGNQPRYNHNWDKNPQARDAYLAGPESYQNYHDQNRSTSGRNYISANDNQPKVPSNNPKWYRNNEGRKAYLRGEKDFRSYPSPNRPGSSRE